MGRGYESKLGKKKETCSELQKKKLLCFSELFQVECLTPNCYLFSPLAKVIQLASKPYLLLFHSSQWNQQQQPGPHDFMGNSRVHNLLIKCIQANRMKVQRYQFRLLNSTFPTSHENKVIWNHYLCGPSQQNCITLQCRRWISTGKEWGTVSDCCIFGSYTAELAKLWMTPELQQENLLLIRPYAIPVFATDSLLSPSR